MTQYRAFRRKSDGRWLTALLTTTKPRFGIRADEHAAQVAAGYGLTANDLAVVDGDSDPRDGALVFPRPKDAGHPLALAKTLLADVLDVLQANAIVVPPPVRNEIRDRLRDRLSGVL